MRDYLVYTSAGLHSSASMWATTENRNYDVWITNYSDVQGNLREFADIYNESKGSKFQNFKKVVEKNRELIKQYKAVMVTDDDIAISPKKLNKLFQQLSDQNLWIIAPAYSRFGKITHDTTERHLLSRYRYTNFVEVTCPIFRTDKLLKFMDVYNSELSCYGVDWWYLNVIGNSKQSKIVISDENYCTNPRDLRKGGGVREIDQLNSHSTRSEAWKKLKKERGISSFKKVIFHSEDRSVAQLFSALPLYTIERCFSAIVDSAFLWRHGSRLKRSLFRLLKIARGRDNA